MIYDCFLYNNEVELLNIRLNELCLCDDMVTHIAIEADATHTGHKKEIYPLIFDTDKKVHNVLHFIVDDMPIRSSAREMEKFQRNKIMRALEFFEPRDEDRVIVSDVDEVPRAKQVDKFKPSMEFAALIQDKYAYYLNWLESEQSWDRARIMLWGYLKDKTPEEVRNSGYDISIHHAGWHWSWCINPVEKLQSFSHTELNTEENIERVKKRENIWDDNRFKKISINLSHPEYLYKNQDKFKHLIDETI